MSQSALDSTAESARAASTLLRTGFHTAVDATDASLVLRLRGELDMASAPGLARSLDTVLDARPAAVTLDLTDLTFVDSSGIHVLIIACRRAGSEGCSFALRAPCRSVLKALRLTGVDRLMVIKQASALL